MSVLVVAHSSSEIPEGLMNNPVYTPWHRDGFRMTIHDQEVGVLGQVINPKGVQPRYEQSFSTGNRRLWCIMTPIRMFVNTLHNACRSVNTAMYCFHTNRQLNLPDQMLGLPPTTTNLYGPGQNSGEGTSLLVSYQRELANMTDGSPVTYILI